MIKLPPSEEQLMQYIWELKSAYSKDIVSKYPEPKPAATTISTLLKRLNEKGFITYTTNGTSREYSPLIKKEDYFEVHLSELVKNHFKDSFLNLASFFTKKNKLNTHELQELEKIIQQQLKEQKP